MSLVTFQKARLHPFHLQDPIVYPNLKELHSHCRKLERRWRLKYNQTEQTNFKVALKNYHLNIRIAKKSHFTEMLNWANSNQKNYL